MDTAAQRTIGASLRSAAKYLADCGIEDAYTDAEIIISHILNMRASRIISEADRVLPEGSRQKFNRLVARRGELREPVAYIMGFTEWYGLKLNVSPSVLIPRPSTETLVDIASDRLPATGTFADIGTGSGAITIGMLTKSRRAMAVATDVDGRALEIAEQNARLHGVADRIVFVEGDLFEPLGDDCFDMILSNPPYVPDRELGSLSPELSHEPRRALAGGADGLAIVKRILAESPSHLVEGGHLMMEVGYNQAERVRELALQSGFKHVNFFTDLDGIERVMDAW